MKTKKKKKLVFIGIIMVLVLGFFLWRIREKKQQVFAQSIAFSGPIQINADNYRQHYQSYQNLGSFIARAVVLSDARYSSAVFDLETIKSFNNPNVELRIGFGSLAIMQNLITNTEAQRLKNLGVTTLTYNPEGQHTPSHEFNNRFNADSTNPIVQFANFAHKQGFRSVWAPLRMDADNITDEALNLIYQAGLDGLAMQEQRFIESHCVSERSAAVDQTIKRHEAIAGRTLESTVQIMSQRCSQTSGSCPLSGWDRCDAFVDQINPVVDIIGIWPTGDETQFIQILRQGSTPPAEQPPIDPPNIPPTLSADINQDGEVNSIDLRLVLNHWGGVGQCSGFNCDIYQDGKINAFDASLVWRAMGGELTTSTSGTLPPAEGLQPNNYQCTMVIGYSQVGMSGQMSDGWYVAPSGSNNFETVVEDGQWQLLWHSGHGVDRWQNPDTAGWNDWEQKALGNFISPCLVNSDNPDRVLLSVSGPYGSDEQAWASNIQAAVNTIKQKIPSVQQILLQPVVGGLNHQTCPCVKNCTQGNEIRASWQHKHIDAGIEIVAGNNPDVEVGFSPEVRVCSDYTDGLGHLTPEGAVAAGQAIAVFYR